MHIILYKNETDRKYTFWSTRVHCLIDSMKDFRLTCNVKKKISQDIFDNKLELVGKLIQVYTYFEPKIRKKVKSIKVFSICYKIELKREKNGFVSPSSWNDFEFIPISFSCIHYF